MVDVFRMLQVVGCGWNSEKAMEDNLERMSVWLLVEISFLLKRAEMAHHKNRADKYLLKCYTAVAVVFALR